MLQIDWDPRQITPRCVDRAAYSAVARQWDVRDTDNFWERACVMACLGVPPEKLKRYLSRGTNFGQCGFDSMIPKLIFFHEELCIDRAKLASLCTVHSRLLDYSLENTMRKRVTFFKAYLDVDGRGLGKIVARHPRLLWVCSPPPLSERSPPTQRTILHNSQVFSIYILWAVIRDIQGFLLAIEPPGSYSQAMKHSCGATTNHNC